MNGSQDLCDSFSTQLQEFPGADIWLAPPLVYLPTLASYKRLQCFVALGAQNIHEEVRGAFTGEISAAMVAENGAKFAIIGHSERRTIYHENDTIVARKLKSCVEASLVPVFCVGESLAQRQNGLAQDIVQQQLQVVKKWRETSRQTHRVVIAYEPVWAIGTGISASPRDAEEMHGNIRAFLRSEGPSLPVLYGGSVKPDNAQELIHQPNIDGFLVGGASLDPSSFNAICQVVSGV